MAAPEVRRVAEIALLDRADNYWRKSQITLCWERALVDHFVEIYQDQAVSQKGAGLRKMKQVMSHQLDSAVRGTRMSEGSVVTLHINTAGAVACKAGESSEPRHQTAVTPPPKPPNQQNPQKTRSTERADACIADGNCRAPATTRPKPRAHQDLQEKYPY